MARRRHKKRTHVGAHNGPATGSLANSSASRGPKTMVIRVGAGEVGSSVSQLVKDVRSMMEPGTASRLKVNSPDELYALRQTLITSRSVNRTNCGITPPWPAPWAYLICCSSRDLQQETPIYASHSLPEARLFTSVCKSTLYAKMCGKH